jgi:beta-lactamase superfamily II metal-dependent hydrolase
MPAGAERAKAREFVKALFGAIKQIAKAIESWFIETLADPEEDATSAENNSSVVLLIDIDGERFLFTADAGVPALTEAANRAEALGVDLKAVKYVQVPHHGSRRNVGPTILNRVLGPIVGEGGSRKYAFVSAAKESDKHPAKKVTNAFKRRGAKVYATQGRSVWQHSSGAPERDGWTAITDLPLYTEVED